MAAARNRAEITDSRKHRVYHKDPAELGKFAFSSDDYDVYDVCFSRAVVDEGKPVPGDAFTSITLDIKSGVEAKSYAAVSAGAGARAVAASSDHCHRRSPGSCSSWSTGLSLGAPAVPSPPLRTPSFFSVGGRQVGEAEHLKPIELELRKLEDLSESIVQDFAEMKAREELHRDTNGACARARARREENFPRERRRW